MDVLASDLALLLTLIIIVVKNSLSSIVINLWIINRLLTISNDLHVNMCWREPLIEVFLSVIYDCSVMFMFK